MNPAVGWAVATGIALGVGLWTLLLMIPSLGRPKLHARVAPYLVGVSEGARSFVARRPVEPLSAVGSLLKPGLSRAGGLLATILGAREIVRTRLHQAGSDLSVEEFRVRQVVGLALAFAAAMPVSVAATAATPLPPLSPIALSVAIPACVVVAQDAALAWHARRRLARMRDELPTVLEFLTLSLSAGEGILDAIRRVGQASHGQLARELAEVVASAALGAPLADSLRDLAIRLDLPPLSRAIDQLIGALERGTPLAEVLRAQAQDARDESKRALLETAGRKEVAMLVPLVFGLLPVTIAFAIFPGIFVLQLGL